MVPTPNATNNDNAPPLIQELVQIPSGVVTPEDALIIQATVADDSDSSVTVEINLSIDGAPSTLALLDDGAHDDQVAGRRYLWNQSRHLCRRHRDRVLVEIYGFRSC